MMMIMNHDDDDLTLILILILILMMIRDTNFAPSTAESVLPLGRATWH